MKNIIERVATFKEKSDAIQKLITPSFFKKMITYSIFRLDKVFNIKFDLDKGFRGIVIQDIISETIESFLKPNGRNWYKNNFPEFEKQFISALDSVISNTVKKELGKANKTFGLLENDSPNDSSNESYEEDIEECLEILEQLNATDDEILLFEPYIINRMKREDLAEAYGISINGLTNIKKRLVRKLPLLKAELKKRNKT